MGYLKQIVKQIPGVYPICHFVAGQYQSLRLKGKTAESVFTDIRSRNRWGGADSVSGTGSDLLQTRVVRNELPLVCREYGVLSMLDIPCGDYHWMKHVDFEAIDYTGADIVTDLIRGNSQYETANVHFCKLNLICDKLPRVDLIFCRDCLVHLSFSDAIAALHNMCDSGSKYLLTTTFTGRLRNHDIVTGAWRTLNLDLAPFSLPAPLKIINEECAEGDRAFSDKSLGLWRLGNIKEGLTIRNQKYWRIRS